MESFRELPERIRQIRQNKGLSQENMADGLGISTTAYGDLERGKTEITLSRLSAIAEALEITVPFLLGIPGEERPEAGWLKEENSRLVRENMALLFRNELLEARLKAIREAGRERERIGF